MVQSAHTIKCHLAYYVSRERKSTLRGRREWRVSDINSSHQVFVKGKFNSGSRLQCFILTVSKIHLERCSLSVLTLPLQWAAASQTRPEVTFCILKMSSFRLRRKQHSIILTVCLTQTVTGSAAFASADPDSTLHRFSHPMAVLFSRT